MLVTAAQRLPTNCGPVPAWVTDNRTPKSLVTASSSQTLPEPPETVQPKSMPDQSPDEFLH